MSGSQGCWAHTLDITLRPDRFDIGVLRTWTAGDATEPEVGHPTRHLPPRRSKRKPQSRAYFNFNHKQIITLTGLNTETYTFLKKQLKFDWRKFLKYSI